MFGYRRCKVLDRLVAYHGCGSTVRQGKFAAEIVMANIYRVSGASALVGRRLAFEADARNAVSRARFHEEAEPGADIHDQTRLGVLDTDSDEPPVVTPAPRPVRRP
jgi:hypothetical protein